MGRLFGTDGVRGIANGDLSSKLATNIARAAVVVMEDDLGRKPVFLVGTDTRLSADMLEASINAGLCSSGADAINLKVVPTPAVAYLVSRKYADSGIMISASHNPYEYNGIKIFGSGGYKLTDEQEFEIENIILDKVRPYLKPWKDDIGTIKTSEGLLDHYIDHLVETMEGTDVSGFNIAIDCSNGSASATAHQLFSRLGVNIDIVSCSPNGTNINDNCGSTHIENLAAMVKKGNYDAGFAFDGDADRCLMVDENGEVINGDIILAILSLDMKNHGRLKGNTLVATVMSNMGLFKFAEENDINMEITKVGDRYVLEKMLEGGYNVGGEQSGHVILSDYMTTGDGQMTAIHMLGAMKRSGKKASEMAKVMKMYPQVSKNIKADSAMKSALAVDEGAQKIIAEAGAKLGKEGRILVRPSGTEPLIRVMIEGTDTNEIECLLKKVANDLEDRLKYNQSYKPVTDED